MKYYISNEIISLTTTFNEKILSGISLLFFGRKFKISQNLSKSNPICLKPLMLKISQHYQISQILKCPVVREGEFGFWGNFLTKDLYLYQDYHCKFRNFKCFSNSLLQLGTLEYTRIKEYKPFK